ncbi:MAG TPA: hypothetical protein VFG78_06425 [Gemmatimonadota bacterium]|nr:hypothetical protein [Gemmatimonadota bacterium]
MSARPLLLVLAVGGLIAAGCEEERRAWVSILPVGGEDEEEKASEGRPAGPLGVSEDGRAVVLGEDTLFTAARLPSRARGELGVEPLRFQRVVFSPDSSRVAFATAGANEAVGVWSRTGQTGLFLDAFQGGRVDSLAWAPEGRFLAWGGRTREGISRVSMADPAGRRVRHPVLEGLVREGRSAILQGWIDAARARVLVTSGPRAGGGLAYVWDALLNNFILESHIDPLVERAPPAPPAPGGIFSVDLLGGGAPETVALYRSTGGAPAALLLESRAGEFQARTTDPLLEPADVGLERWEDGTPNLGLYAPLRVAGVPLLLLELPSPDPVVMTIGAYRVGGDGALEMARVAMPEGRVAAIFQDGQVGDESRQLGVVDLDRDGSPELVVAVGTRIQAGGTPSVRWRATVLGWSESGLVPRPALEAEALARIARITGTPADSAAAADTTAGAP